MNGADEQSTGHSPFWPITVVFVALMIGYSIQLWGLFNQRQQIQKTEASLRGLEPQARLVNTTLQKVSQELIELSATSAPAKQIVNDFNIRINQRK